MKTNVVRTAEKKREPNLLRAGVILGVAFVATLGIGLALQSASRGGDAENQATVASAERPGKKTTKPTTQRTAPRTAVAETTPVRETVVAAATPTAPVEVEPAVDDAPVTYEEAERVFLEGDYERAAILLGAYTRQKSENVWGHYLRGLALHRADRLEEAEEAYRSALEIDGDHPKTLVNLARTLLKSDRPAEALNYAARASETWPENVDAHRTRARALHTMGHAGEALEAYADALAIDPEDSWSLNNSGLILIEDERFEEAVDPLRKACTANESEARFFNNLGIALERSGDLVGAKEAFASAIAIDAGYEKSLVSLARVDRRIEEGAESAPILVLEPTETDEVASVPTAADDSTPEITETTVTAETPAIASIVPAEEKERAIQP